MVLSGFTACTKSAEEYIVAANIKFSVDDKYKYKTDEFKDLKIYLDKYGVEQYVFQLRHDKKLEYFTNWKPDTTGYVGKDNNLELFDSYIINKDSIYHIYSNNIISFKNGRHSKEIYFYPDSVTSRFLKKYNINIGMYDYDGGFTVLNNSTFLNMLPYTSNLAEFYSHPFVGLFTLNPTNRTYSLKRQFVIVDSKYKKENYGVNNPIIVVTKSKLLHIMPDAPIVYCTNIADGITSQTKLKLNGFEPVKPFSKVYEQSTLEYMFRTSNINNVIYDSYRNVYYLSYKTPQEPTDEKGMEKNITYSAFEFCVLDSQFNIINQIHFDDNLYNGYRFEVCKSGVLFRKKNEDQILYDILKF